MASTAIPEAVFLDAQVFESASFNFKTKPFTALRRHLESGRLRLVVIDITVAEVRARIEKNVVKELAVHERFRKDARVLRSSSLPQVGGALVELHAAKIIKGLQAAFEDFLKKNKAQIIDTTEQKAGPIFEKYFAGKPPFGPEGKKNEFPDAFVVQALIEWTEHNEAELFVVSGDKPFVKACGECDELHAKGSLAEVLDHVASDDKKLAKFIRSQLVDRAHTIAEKAKSQFEDLGFYVKDEWGDVEVEVTDIQLDGEPEILEVSGKEATVQMTFETHFDAHLSYDDSSTGVWDSEDGVMMFMDHKEETVKRKDDLVVEVRVTFEGMDPQEFEIDEIDLVEPSRGYGINTADMEGYPWK
jgi:hypothetical protein